MEKAKGIDSYKAWTIPILGGSYTNSEENKRRGLLLSYTAKNEFSKLGNMTRK